MVDMSHIDEQKSCDKITVSADMEVETGSEAMKLCCILSSCLCPRMAMNFCRLPGSSRAPD